MRVANASQTGATTIGLLTATGAETVYDTTAVINFAINGKGEQKATVTDGATPTTDGFSGDTFTQDDDTNVIYVWCLNAAGTVSVFAGDAVSIDADSGEALYGDAEFPGTIDLDTYCPFAYIKVKNQSGSAFAFGTTNWNTSNVTLTIQDVLFGLPGRPA